MLVLIYTKIYPARVYENKDSRIVVVFEGCLDRGSCS